VRQASPQHPERKAGKKAERKKRNGPQMNANAVCVHPRHFGLLLLRPLRVVRWRRLAAPAMRRAW
jgi:hypothetical protein